MPQMRVGIAGWSFAPWRGNFYPPGLKQSLELPFASRRFRMLEVNGTFYSLQSPKTFSEWYSAAPDDFEFAVKGNSFVTQIRRLKEPRQGLANFFSSGVLCLKEKLGPILWQLPPNLAFDEKLCAEFARLLPRDTHELAKLATEHDSHVKKGTELAPDANRPVRHVIETRHESYLCERYFAILREHNIAHVVADEASLHPTSEDITADFVYVRLHGERIDHESGYTLEEIQTWGKRIKTWSEGGEPDDARRNGPKASEQKYGRDIYINFDNTQDKLLSPVNALQMATELGLIGGQSAHSILEQLGVTAPKAKRASAISKSIPAKKKPIKKGSKKEATRKQASAAKPTKRPAPIKRVKKKPPKPKSQ